MDFLADENVFLPIVRELRRLGNDVLDIKEQNLTGIADPDVYQMAVDQKRVLLTMDKDFTNILKYSPGTHPGIIVLKLYRLPVTTTTNIFIHAFNALNETDILGNIVIIDRFKTRVRRH